MHSPPAILKHVFDEYNLSIISNLFNNNKPGFIRSGKIRGKHIFFEMVRESQGKSGKVREFNEKVRENLEKVREIFLESSYLL